jgi:hypothetical protein
VTASRLPRLVRLGVVAAATALVVTSCGTDLRPGTAAVVGDTTISEDEVDDLVAAACEYTEAIRLEQGSGSRPTQSIANLRTSVTRQLIQAEVTRSATEELGLTVNEATVSALASGSSFPEGVEPDDEELLTAFFEEQSRSLLGQAVVGAHLQDESVTVADETLGQDDVDAARDYLAEQAQQLDVKVNPAYGTWSEGDLTTASGSLSDPVSDAARAAFADTSGDPGALSELPESQVCG